MHSVGPLDPDGNVLAAPALSSGIFERLGWDEDLRKRTIPEGVACLMVAYVQIRVMTTCVAVSSVSTEWNPSPAVLRI